jgi:hypothetical protein
LARSDKSLGSGPPPACADACRPRARLCPSTRCGSGIEHVGCGGLVCRLDACFSDLFRPAISRLLAPDRYRGGHVRPSLFLTPGLDPKGLEDESVPHRPCRGAAAGGRFAAAAFVGLRLCFGVGAPTCPGPGLDAHLRHTGLLRGVPIHRTIGRIHRSRDCGVRPGGGASCGGRTTLRAGRSFRALVDRPAGGGFGRRRAAAPVFTRPSPAPVRHNIEGTANIEGTSGPRAHGAPAP